MHIDAIMDIRTRLVVSWLVDIATMSIIRSLVYLLWCHFWRKNQCEILHLVCPVYVKVDTFASHGQNSIFTVYICVV